MSDTIIVEVGVIEASALVVDVIAPPPAAVVVEVVDWGSVPVGYPSLPAELSQVPISFPFGGRPSPGTVVNVPMGFSLTVPSGLAGTVTYAMTPPQANATFLLNHVSGSVVAALGTITLTPASHTSCVLVGSGGALAVGDVLQIVAPTQDLALSDCGITIMTNRE